MPIVVTLDVQLAIRKMSLTELANRVGITIANLSVLKNDHAKAVRISTLDAICRELRCQPGDLLRYEPDEESAVETTVAVAPSVAAATEETLRA